MNLQTQKIRNIGIVGHSAAGKTSFSEAMLYCAGVTNRMGSIEEGNTVSDYHGDEVERKMSIHSTILSFGFEEAFFNVIDTPGYADFMGDVKGSLRVCDLALILVDSANGLQIGTNRAWNYSEEFGLAKIFCINGLDRENADFDTQVETLKKTWGNHVIPLQIPVDQGNGFSSVIDLLANKMFKWQAGGKGEWEECPIPGDLADSAATWRQELIETVAESDDALLEKYFDKGELTDEEISRGLALAVAARSIFPVVCSASTHNIGVKRIMQLIAGYGPSPAFKGEYEGVDGSQRKISDSEPISAFIFKTVSEQHMGELSFFRVNSGTLTSGMDLRNVNQDATERLNQIFLMNGKNRTDVAALPAGAIAAVVKLKHTHTNNTLCDAKAPIEFAPTQYPEPCIRFAMAPAAKGDEDKFSRALSTMHEEDPTFSYMFDGETNQTIAAGMGELHITTVVERIKSRYKLDVAISQPRVPFRETIRSKSESKYRHKKQSGGAGQFAEVWMRVEPLARGEGVQFTESLVGQNVDRGFVPSVDKGVKAVCKEGIIAGCQVVDVKVNFYDGKMHPVDSNDMAFQIAGRGAFKQAFESADPYLLEPIYEIEVYVPEQYMGDVMGDISSRRGRIQGMDANGHFEIIKALVPQTNLYKYSTTLRSLTHGTAEHMEKFSHYEEMPRDQSKQVIEEYSKGESNSKVLAGV